jgi:RimJ/RimL family protein N-acetyltransferase
MRLKTPRLLIRDLTMADLDPVHRLLDLDLEMEALSRQERADWLQWTLLDYAQRRRLYQPPYGDYAMELAAGGQVIGLVGLVPSMMPFGLLPGYAGEAPYNIPEVGLFWAVSPDHQRQGYATEAGSAVIGYGFGSLHLRRMVATTERENDASIGVMRRLGMRIEHNPSPAPFFLRVVGVLENPGPAPEWPTHPQAGHGPPTI